MSKTRIIFLGLFLSFMLYVFLLFPRLLNPKVNLNQLILMVEKGDKQTLFQSATGYLKIFPKGYILILYSGDDPKFNSTEFIVIFKKEGQLEIELINGSGIENINMMYGEEATKYLVQHQISIERLEKVLNY